MSTPHNKAKKGDIAKLVIMPGDPLRAKFIAETYLENPVMFNDVRNMYGYTGKYNRRPISVMGSGMGMPSMGIYSYELYKFYDVESIIRVGSCATYDDKAKLGDIYLVDQSYTDGTYGKYFGMVDDDTLMSSPELDAALVKSAESLGITMPKAKSLCTDAFYRDGGYDRDAKKAEDDKFRNMDISACDMESYALFCNAEVLKKKASCLLSISDIMTTREGLSPEDRQKTFTNMIKIAMNVVNYI